MVYVASTITEDAEDSYVGVFLTEEAMNDFAREHPSHKVGCSEHDTFELAQEFMLSLIEIDPRLEVWG